MKKSGFTMIELIFVIVILGILAAVALPKFVGMASQAREGNLKSFTGTLNGTVGPSWWSSAMSSGYDGNISALGIESEDDLKKYTDLPKELTDFNLSHCDDTANYKIVAQFDKDKVGTEENYYIACKDGTASEAPKFILIKPTSTDGNDLALGDQNSSTEDATTHKVNFKHGSNDREVIDIQ